MAASDPDLTPGECALQAAIVRECRRLLDGVGSPCLLVEAFGLDVAVWLFAPPSTLTKFIELKVFSGARQGGVGFGNGKGQGPQVDILIQDPSTLRLLDPSTRWILADATRPRGTDRYSLLTSTSAREAAMGQVARHKQNNFGLAAIRQHAVTWPRLCEELAEFLLEGQSTRIRRVAPRPG